MKISHLVTLSEAQTPRYGEYKGRKYLIKFMGKTKFGERANLAFLDGSKDFWVAADQVKPVVDQATGAVHKGSVSPAALLKTHGRPQTGTCVSCGGPLSQWERSHGLRKCADCRDGGSRARGGQSYYDRHGNFVLGDDD